jgi:hypothetical protein
MYFYHKIEARKVIAAKAFRFELAMRWVAMWSKPKEGRTLLNPNSGTGKHKRLKGLNNLARSTLMSTLHQDSSLYTFW